MAEVKWIKLACSLGSDAKMREVRRQKNGDSMALLWVLLLCRAGEVNDGGRVYIAPGVPYTTRSLANDLGFPEKIVSEALKLFARLGMIETTNGGGVQVVNWEKHQNIITMEKIREQTRQRVAQHRYKNSQCNVTCNVTGNVTDGESETLPVTHSNAREEEGEEEREEDKDKDPKKDFDKSFIGVGVTGAHARFAPPTVDDILSYCRETGVTIDAQRFVDFYASKGWKVGMAPMTDWRASVRSWAARDRAEAKKQNPRFDYQQREYTEEDFGESFYFDPRRDLERYYGDGGADDASG